MRKLKIQKLIDKYEFDGLESELRRKYVEEDQSLRDLAEYMNIMIARKFFNNKPFSGEHVYRVFNKSEQVSKQEQSDLRRRLQEEEIDFEELEQDWVGHMPVKSFLNRVLEIDTSRERNSRSPEKAITDIRRLVDYQESVIREILAGVNEFSLESWNLHTDHRLIDADTGESVRLENYLQELDEDS